MSEKSQTQQIIDDIRKGNYTALQKIYPLYREAFLAWARQRYTCTDDDILDIYQDALIVFYNNVVQGKLTTLNATLKTYLFAIGKNMLLRKYESTSRIRSMEEQEEILIPDLSLQYQIEEDHRRVLLKEAIQKLGEVCRQLIVLFYYHRYSIESIRNEMNYNHIDVVRTQKGRCVKQLKDIIQTQFKNQLY